MAPASSDIQSLRNIVSCLPSFTTIAARNSTTPLAVSCLAAIAASCAFPQFFSRLPHSADFMVSLPLLWTDFLGWITPPCLFVLLNFIILTLTLTSGFIFNGPSSAGSELVANFFVKSMDSAVQRSQGGSSPLFAKQLIDEQGGVEEEGSHKLSIDGEGMGRETCGAEDAPEGSEEERNAMKACSSVAGLEGEDEYSLDGAAAARAKALDGCDDAPSTTSSISAPSSVSSPSSSSSNEAAASDDLSDEDLRDRIEAFISRVKAHIRREAATAMKELNCEGKGGHELTC